MILRIAAIIAAVEFVIMVGLARFAERLDPQTVPLIDAVLLTLIAAPLISIWVVRPFALSREHALRRANFVAGHDALTALPNRRLLHERIIAGLEQAADRNLGAALLFIDLDGFKQVNDRHGHAAGDALLQQVALRLRNHVRREDAVARVGGDEFVVLLCNLPDDLPEARAAVCAAARKIAGEIDLPYPFGDTTLSVRASIGIRVVGAEAIDADTLLREADAAMYLAKADPQCKIWIRSIGTAAAQPAPWTAGPFAPEP